MGAMVPPSRKSCYNFRVTKINRVVDGDTIDVTIDLGFDLYKKERVMVAILVVIVSWYIYYILKMSYMEMNDGSDDTTKQKELL